MTFRKRITAHETAESLTAKKIAQLLTIDMGIDLDRVGYYLIRNHPRIVWHRFEAVALSASEESELLEEEFKKMGVPKWR